MNETSLIICEGTCNPQHQYLMEKVVALRSLLTPGEPMSGPVLDGLHSLRHTPHTWTRRDYGHGGVVDMFACVFCSHERVYGRRERMSVPMKPFLTGGAR